MPKQSPRTGQAIQVRDVKTGRWLCSRVRHRVSDGFRYNAPWTYEGSSFMWRDSRNWRRVRKGVC